MKQLIFLFIFIPTIVFSQKKDYKTYDKAIRFFNEGNNEKAKKLSLRLIEKNFDWDDPHLLLASIYAEEGEVDLSATYLLNVYDENNPKDIYGIEKIAKWFYNNGRYHQSIYYFKKLLNLDSTLAIKNIYLSEARNRYGYPVYKLSVQKILQNCHFAIKSIKQPVSFNPYNMGEHINSSFAEYLPAISTRNNLFFITIMSFSL